MKIDMNSRVVFTMTAAVALPADTNDDDLPIRFSEYGSITRIPMAAVSKVIAPVQREGAMVIVDHVAGVCTVVHHDEATNVYVMRGQNGVLFLQPDDEHVKVGVEAIQETLGHIEPPAPSLPNAAPAHAADDEPF